MTPDLIYIGIAVIFFALTWGLVKMCEKLSNHEPGSHS